MRVLLVSGVIGQLLRMFSVVFVAPIGLALWDREFRHAGYFAIGMATTLVGGLGLGSTYQRVQTLRRSEALAVVAGAWLVVGHFAATPYLFFGIPPVDALFESISGFTTTGATILRESSVDRYGRAFFLWRAMTQWFGGLGVIALFVLILPRLGIAGRQLFFAEASDAASESISPQVKQTARRLWILYSLLTVLLMVALMVCGLTPYDSLVHALTTLAAGGFSPHSESFGGYHNPAVEWIVTIFMFLAGTSFSLLWRGFTGRPGAFFRDGEFMLYLGTTLIATVGLAFVVGGGVPTMDTLRQGAFQASSLISSTGFASVDYNLWGDDAKAILVAVMLVGGCAGSAAGGAKVIRLVLVLKFLWSEITQVLHPRAVLPIRYGRRIIPPEILRTVFTLWVRYLTGYLIVGLLLVLLGSDYITGFSAALACLGNVGPGFAQVGPMGHYADLPILSKLVLTFAMWIGRLEIVAVLALLHPHVWRNLQLKRTGSRLSYA